MKAEGIFRVSGSSVQIKLLKKFYDKGEICRLGTLFTSERQESTVGETRGRPYSCGIVKSLFSGYARASDTKRKLRQLYPMLW